MGLGIRSGHCWCELVRVDAVTRDILTRSGLSHRTNFERRFLASRQKSLSTNCSAQPPCTKPEGYIFLMLPLNSSLRTQKMGFEVWEIVGLLLHIRTEVTIVTFGHRVMGSSHAAAETSVVSLLSRVSLWIYRVFSCTQVLCSL